MKLTRRQGRRKMVTTGAITSRKLAMVDCTAETVYWRAYMACDNYGTMGGDPWDVMQAALPGKSGITEDVVAAALDALVSIGLLERWTELDGTIWIHLLGHDLHQQASWLGRRGERKTPVPPSLRIENDEYRAGFDPVNDDESSPAIAGEGSFTASGAGSESSPATASAPTTTTSTTSTSKETDERAQALTDQVAPATTESFALNQAIAIFLDCSKGGIDESMWRSQLEQHRSRNLGAPIERYVDAAMQMRAKALDSGRPFTMSSGWSWFTKAWASLARDEHGVARRDMATRPASPRSMADVLAENEAVWGGAA